MVKRSQRLRNISKQKISVLLMNGWDWFPKMHQHVEFRLLGTESFKSCRFKTKNMKNKFVFLYKL